MVAIFDLFGGLHFCMEASFIAILEFLSYFCYFELAGSRFCLSWVRVECAEPKCESAHGGGGGFR